MMPIVAMKTCTTVVKRKNEGSGEEKEDGKFVSDVINEAITQNDSDSHAPSDNESSDQ